MTPRIDSAAQRGKRAFHTLSASAIGLELGLSVVIGVLFGMWLDRKAGTEPWLTIVFLGIGFAAGIRGLVRAARRSERAQREEDQHGGS